MIADNITCRITLATKAHDNQHNYRRLIQVVGYIMSPRSPGAMVAMVLLLDLHMTVLRDLSLLFEATGLGCPLL